MRLPVGSHSGGLEDLNFLSQSGKMIAWLPATCFRHPVITLYFHPQTHACSSDRVSTAPTEGLRVCSIDGSSARRVRRKRLRDVALPSYAAAAMLQQQQQRLVFSFSLHFVTPHCCFSLLLLVFRSLYLSVIFFCYFYKYIYSKR